MYAAYSAAFSRMLSESTPGRAMAAPGVAEGGFLSATSQRNRSRYPNSSDSATSLGWSGCATSARCRISSAMIAKQRHRRHCAGQSAQGLGKVRDCAQARRRRQPARGPRVHASSQSMARPRRSLRSSLRALLPRAPPARPRAGSSASPALRATPTRSSCHAGSRQRQRPQAARRRPARAPSQHRRRLALSQPLPRLASRDGRGAARRTQRLRSVAGMRPG